ncbi:MAG TPA: CoA-binding protein [Syntrophomonadaceae bacterium]|nr:CoA-binding protein [Syntrophomonadaceae bacterium]
MNDFFTKFQRFAVLGLSRNPNSFSRKACSFLASQGCEVFPVNPSADNIDGRTCYTIESLPEVQAAIFFTNPRVTSKLLPSLKSKGIVHAWFQRGSADQTVIKEAQELGISYKNSCLFMHHPNASFPHRFHGGILRLFNLDN